MKGKEASGETAPAGSVSPHEAQDIVDAAARHNPHVIVGRIFGRASAGPTRRRPPLPGSSVRRKFAPWKKSTASIR